MSFRVTPNPTFTATAQIKVPSNDGFEDRELKVRFRLLSDSATPSTASSGDDFLREAVDCLFDLVDEQGKRIEFNADVLDDLIRWPFVRVGLIAAYFKTVNGIVLGN